MDRLDQAFADWRRDSARAAYHADPDCKTQAGRDARDELCRIAIERRTAQRG